MHRAALAVLMMLPAGGIGAQTIQAGPLELDLAGRLQFQVHTTSITAAEAGVPVLAGTAFEMRRARFGTAMRFGDWMSGHIEVEFAGGGARLTDGFVDIPVAEGLIVRAGQFKKPFSLIELTSSTRTLTIERGARIRGLATAAGPVAEEQVLLNAGAYVGRDLGAMVHGARGRLGYAMGVFNGSGANVAEARETKAVAARGTVRVAPRLELGVAASRQPSGVVATDGDEVVGTVWGVDAEYGAFRAPGLHVMAEAMMGDAPGGPPADEPATMWGFQAAAGWFAPRQGRVEGIEPVLRVGLADRDVDSDDDAGLLITPGINLYFVGRNRLMVNGELYFPRGAPIDAAHALVAQLQVYF